jgi:poly(ADP-ribose) glycohydrolase ARH3
MTDSYTDRFVGSIAAAALGDAFGAPYEGGVLERCLWKLIGTTSGKHHWTDDTQMSLDFIESLLALGTIDQDDLAHRFATSYRWSRGYGPGAARILKLIRRGVPWQVAVRRVYSNGSFGNGGAMRAPVIGLFYARAGEEKVAAAASAAAAVTHAHPLAKEGAVLVALATAFALGNVEAREIVERLAKRAEAQEYAVKLHKALEWFNRSNRPDVHEVAKGLGNGIAAVDSCVSAIYIAQIYRERPYEELLEFAICLGGDVDTIASMSSAIWSASNGLSALPESLLEKLEYREGIVELAKKLARKSENIHLPGSDSKTIQM